MKRGSTLAMLSRDHHHALVVAQKLKRANVETAADVTREFLDFWARDGAAHFRLEEELVLPAYAAYGDVRHPVVVQTLVDHVEIRRDADAAAAVADAPPLPLLNSLGVRLAAHVRFEERQLFPLVERALPDEQLVALGERLIARDGRAP